MATKLEVYNEAALILKLRPVDSLSENTPVRVTFDQAWAPVLRYMLGLANWHFAKRALAIQAETSITPSYGYSAYFAKPDDFARLIGISASAYGVPTLENYSEEGAYWAANLQTLYIEYVSNGVTYGGDLGRWTPHFTTAVAHEIASRTGGKLTKLSGQEWQAMKKDSKDALHKAKSLEAYAQPAQPYQMGQLVRSRLGGRGWRYYSER